MSDAEGHVYVNLEDKSMVCAINTSSWKVEHSWPLAPGEGPSGLALDNATHRLFSNCDNKLMVVMDAQSGEVITTLPIGDHVDGAVFDPAASAYAPNGEGTLTVVQEDAADKFHVLSTVPTQKGRAPSPLVSTRTTSTCPLRNSARRLRPTPEMPRPRPSLVSGSSVLLDATE
ncbi:MAG: hypothetical protein IPI05_05520 [Flavobacteriales bacterium]|nr:hypothetical protein [Flavobacteriales bacterium]